MASISDTLTARGLAASIVFPTEIASLLDALQPKAVLNDSDDQSGEAILAVTTRKLGFLALDVTPPGPDIPFRLLFEGGGFRLWLRLSQLPGVAVPFGFVQKGAAAVLKPAIRKVEGDREWLVPDPAGGDVVLEGVDLSLLVEGRPGGVARQRLTSGGDGPEGIVELRLVPPTVLLGGSGFGLDVPGSVVLDDSSDAVPPGETRIDGQTVQTAPDQPAWRGLAIRNAFFHLPNGIPFIGGHPVGAHLAVGLDPPGIDLSLRAKVPPAEGRPGIDVLIECHDPGATGLDAFLPTLVEVAMTLPLDGHQDTVDGQALTFAAGTPVVARARFTRGAADPTTRLTLGLESQGEEGILAVHAPTGGIPARVVIGATAFATALVAHKRPDDADASGVVLQSLLIAGLGLSAFLQNSGKVVLRGVEIESAGAGLPLGETLRLRLDYAVDVVVVPIQLGALSVEMSKTQPMRVRHRNVRLTLHPDRPGLEKFELDFTRAEMEIEDPGRWMVDSPGSLFDILGTRSGRGSMWFEVDLRFKLELGPLRVSGATIRATFGDDNKVSASLRGLDISLAIPALLRGEGSLQLLPGAAGGGPGFAADLAVSIVPLNLATRATVLYVPRPDAGSYLLYLRLAVDLPGPIPIANTGIGLYGMAGSFGLNAIPTPVPPGDPDPIGRLLAWDSGSNDAFEFREDTRTFGAEAVLGTLPDMGFAFSTKAGLFVTVPDVAVRAVLWGRVMSPRLKVTDRPGGAEVGLSFKGVASVDPQEGVGLALLGKLAIPVLLDATVPLGAWFPAGGEAGKDLSDWFIYLGADGYTKQGRGIGPVRATILPGPLSQSADAYVMLRGNGIEAWPRGEPGALDRGPGFVLAFGFGLDISIGPKPIAWLEIGARADVLLSTSPLTLAGFGQLAGSLNLGPFSIGVEARLAFLVAEGMPASLAARVCGRIDLFFCDIEGCVEIAINGKPPRKVPPPVPHPLDRVQNGVVVGDLVHLIDHRYERIATLSRSAADAPVVWPDSLLHLGFTITPTAASQFSAGQFPDAEKQAPPAEPIGSEMLKYTWSLTGLALRDVTDDEDGPGTLEPGPLSAAWQQGKDGELGVRPQAGELVLLTYERDLWTKALADAGAALPPAPSEDPDTLCLFAEPARVGWAVGARAVPEAGAMRMASDPVVPDPTVGRFSALVTGRHSRLETGALTPATAALLPRGWTYRPPAVVAFDPAFPAERDFGGLLQLGEARLAEPNPLFRDRLLGGHAADIVPSEPIGAARLWLVLEEGQERRVSVEDDAGRDWSPHDPVSGALAARPMPDGRFALRYAPPPGAGPDVASIRLRWTGSAPGILGLGGITATARAAAASRNAAAAAGAATLAQAAAAAPQQPGVTTGTAARCLLKPGRTYRLDVAMAWTGTIWEQDETGKAVEVDSQSPPAETRSYFFRTTPVPVRPPIINAVFDAVPQYGTAERMPFVRRRRDIFEPEMLARHLLGYTPAQSEPHRFRDDPVAAHFDTAHVAALAKLYGFTLALDLRRVDVADEPERADNPAKVFTLDANWVPLIEPALLSPGDVLRHARALAAPCPVPKPGGSLAATHPMEGRAWYEAYVLAKTDKPATVADGRLPGVTFRTSRWKGPAPMLAALGFAPGSMLDAAMGRPAGDLAITSLPDFGTPVVEDDDAAFEAALLDLGLGGFPPPSDEPRVSQLWLPAADGGTDWRCAGLLVESPEPIHRPGRAELRADTPPRLVMGRGPGAIMPFRRRDRSGSRLLLLAAQPFAPRSFRLPPGPFGLGLIVIQPHVLLPLADLATGASLPGRLTLNTRPGFAEEA